MLGVIEEAVNLKSTFQNEESSSILNMHTKVHQTGKANFKIFESLLMSQTQLLIHTNNG